MENHVIDFKDNRFIGLYYFHDVEKKFHLHDHKYFEAISLSYYCTLSFKFTFYVT